MTNINRYKEKKDKIDAVILDICMPEYDGIDIFNKIYEINPEVKVIMISGYGPPKKMNTVESKIKGFVPKPFKDDDIGEVVNKVIRGEVYFPNKEPNNEATY